MLSHKSNTFPETTYLIHCYLLWEIGAEKHLSLWLVRGTQSLLCLVRGKGGEFQIQKAILALSNLTVCMLFLWTMPGETPKDATKRYLKWTCPLVKQKLAKFSRRKVEAFGLRTCSFKIVLSKYLLKGWK